MSKRLELWSFGGGVQSTAIAVLIEQGKLPRPDGILWADTGDESEEIYAHIAAWMPRLEAMAPVYVLKKKGKYPRLGDMVIKKALTSKGSNTLPYFLADPKTGAPSLTRRGCTFNYKTEPLNRRAAKLVKEAGADSFRWWLGISRDEMQRMKSDQWHPLVEHFDGRMRSDAMSRKDCERIMADAGESAPRSSCVFCPFRTASEWSSLSTNDRARVTQIDEAIENGFAEHGRHGTLTDRPFIRSDLRAVDGDAWFDGPPSDQMTFGWDNECAGICGV